jgi:hypothetical protein
VVDLCHKQLLTMIRTRLNERSADLDSVNSREASRQHDDEKEPFLRACVDLAAAYLQCSNNPSQLSDLVELAEAMAACERLVDTERWALLGALGDVVLACSAWLRTCPPLPNFVPILSNPNAGPDSKNILRS